LLTEIIDNAYVLFSKHRVEIPLEVCTEGCCMKPEDENRLASLPVRQIPVDLLSEYNDSAKPEKTRISEVKHFLPRYLDLIGQFQFPTHSTELSFTRLIPFDKSEWSTEELNLLGEFSKVFFKKCLSLYPIPSFSDSITTILIMFRGVDFDLKQLFDIPLLLKIWEGEQSLQSILHFRDLYFYGFNQKHESKLSNSFGDKELGSILRTWMESETVRQIFAGNIEKLIVEKNCLLENDSTDLNLLYDIILPKRN
jgi:hypothetical protein